MSAINKQIKKVSKQVKKVKDAVSGFLNKEEESELKKFFIDELKDIYWAEKALTKALPKMAKAATSAPLRNAFIKHKAVTEKHVERLEKIFGLLNEKATAKKCDAMDGLITEANSIIGDTKSGTMVRDTGLIFAAQKVEHYEIATYGSLKAVAGTLMLRKDIISTLNSTLNDEKDADVLLTTIAEGNVNQKASKE